MSNSDHADSPGDREKGVDEKQGSRIDQTQSNVEGSMFTVNVERDNLARVDAAIETIGWGKYQWQLAFTCSFGFLVDQALLVAISMVTPSASLEFGPKYATLLPVAQYAGLLLGAIVLGIVADNFGRRIVWQTSIFGASIFAMIAASSPSWAVLNFWVAVTSFFAGGNLAIDLAVLAESIPSTWTFMLSGLACVWGMGNTLAGMVAWPLLTNLGCPAGSTPETCSKSENMGWRYLYITLGGLCLMLSMVRAFILRSKESPRWLMSIGEIDAAVEVLNGISAANKSDYTASVSDFSASSQTRQHTKSPRENMKRVANLFKGPKKVRLMVCLMLLWMLVGIAYPLFIVFLPYYLAARGAELGNTSTYITYRDVAISSVVGIFGPFLAMWMVASRLRSRISMCISAAACIAFAGAFTTVKNEAQNLAFSSFNGFWLNALYAIIYGYTPQVLDVENRGLGAGLLMALGRLSSLSAPFIATFADVTSSAPIWVACGCYAVIGIVGLLLPVDTASFQRKAK